LSGIYMRSELYLPWETEHVEEVRETDVTVQWTDITHVTVALLLTSSIK